jgi:hypothetical protein
MGSVLITPLIQNMLLRALCLTVNVPVPLCMTGLLRPLPPGRRACLCMETLWSSQVLHA